MVIEKTATGEPNQNEPHVNGPTKPIRAPRRKRANIRRREPHPSIYIYMYIYIYIYEKRKNKKGYIDIQACLSWAFSRLMHTSVIYIYMYIYICVYI